MFEDCTILSMRFPQKLWRIVNECKTGAIRWNISGTTVLLDYKKFQEEYLDAGKSIFKTKNITSFIRQLNLYGFRKVTSHNRDPICNSHNPDVHEFLHENFRVGRMDLLPKVCRKAGGKSKCYQGTDLRNAFKSDPSQKETTRMSRLRLCQLALTEALEQVIQDYQKQKCWNGPMVADSVLNANSYGIGSACPDFNFYAVRSHSGNSDWIRENMKSHFFEENNFPNYNCSNPWYIVKMYQNDPYLYVQNSN